MNQPENVKQEFDVLGTTPVRPDGIDKITGRAIFSDDIHLNNMLFGSFCRSPHAHAKILSIDTSAAEALPGVLAVVTGADFPTLERNRMYSQGLAGMINLTETSENCMARDRVLYDGHAVAAVAADSPHTAEAAARLIKVEYELLTPLMDVQAAMAEGAPVIHEGLVPGAFVMPSQPSLPNAGRLDLGMGDIEQGFAEADIIVEREFNTETNHQGYIESHITTVNWGSNDQITVWTATQGTHGLRDQLAGVIEVPIASVNVIPTEVGGAFGGKERMFLEPAAAMLSKKTGRPIKIALRRDEVFRGTGPGCGTHSKVKIGMRKDGTLVAADVTLCQEAGAYAGGPIALSCLVSTLCYNFTNVRVTGYDVIVNKPTMRPYRAPGAPQSMFAVEQVIDELAEKAGMDPVEFRLKNATKTGDMTASGMPLMPLNTVGMLETIKQHPHYNAPLEGENQGRGLSYIIWGNLGETSSVTISVNVDGSVSLATGSPDMSGSRMTFAMQAAETLGIPAESVTASVSDSKSIGYTSPTVASRTSFGTGLAIIESAKQVIEEMSKRAAILWETPPELIEFENGVFSNREKPEQTISFTELGKRVHETGVPIAIQVSKTTEGLIPACCAHLVDVEVDPETGKTDILRYTAFQDVGKAIHPDYVEGQMQGATVQGIGMALNEGYFYDDEGHMRNVSLLDYRMPTALDLPMIDTVILESPNPAHPYGVRGCGEHSIIPPASALANAIYDAVGVRMDSMPMQPHKICAALKNKSDAEV